MKTHDTNRRFRFVKLFFKLGLNLRNLTDKYCFQIEAYKDSNMSTNDKGQKIVELLYCIV